MDKKFIELEEVIDICEKFINEKITQEELEIWGNTIVVQKFLPMELKARVVDFLINDCYYSENSVDKVVELECNKFWYVLLLYTNINIEGKEEFLTLENYNIIYPVIGYWLRGLVDYDYQVVMNILEQVMNYSNILSIVDAVENVPNIDTAQDMAKFTEDMVNVLQDKEKLTAIADILKYNASKETQVISEIINSEIKKQEEK